MFHSWRLNPQLTLWATNVALASRANGFFLKGLSATGARVSGRRITVADSGPVKLALLLAHGVGTVEGVALREGKPAAGVLVLLLPQSGAGGAAADMDVVRRDQSDSDGSFTLASVLPGAYVVLALENGWELEWSNPAVLAALRPRGQPLRVEPNGKYNLKLNVQ